MIIKSTPEDFVVREILDYQSKLSEQGPYSLYVLRKRGRNTEDCLQWLARALGKPRKDFGVCGNKDRNAVTEQYVTINMGPAVVHTPPEWSMEYIGKTKNPLRMGDHERNGFTITVRELPLGTAKPQLKKIKNFFGEQRFSERNDEIGFMLLHKDYKGAASALGLEYDTDAIGALRKIPKHTLILYVHAAQSRMWNEVATGISAESEQNVLMLPGYGAPLSPEMEAALAMRGLDDGCFVNRSFPEICLEGTERPLWQDVQDYEASEVETDEKGIGVCTLSFTLGKGQYATETVKQLFS